MKKLILIVVVLLLEGCYYVDKFVYKKNDIDRIYEDKRVIKKSEFPSSYYDEGNRIKVSITNAEYKIIFAYLEGKDSFIFKEVAHKRLTKENEELFKPYEDRDKIFMYKSKDKYIVSFYEGDRLFNAYVKKDNKNEYSIIDNYFN